MSEFTNYPHPPAPESQPYWQDPELLNPDFLSRVRYLGETATNAGILSPRIGHFISSFDDDKVAAAKTLYPLFLQFSQPEITPDDVRENIKPISEFKPIVVTADRLAGWLGRMGLALERRRPESRTARLLGSPQEALHRKVAEKLPEKAESAAAKARKTLRELDFLAGFENPKEQFVSEVNLLSQNMLQAIENERQARLQGKHTEEPRKGIIGFISKVAGKVKRFFGFGKTEDTTAQDAGRGIHGILSDEQSTEELPILHKLHRYALERLATNKTEIPKPHYLAAVAPEILTALLSVAEDPVTQPEIRLTRLDVNNQPSKLRPFLGLHPKIDMGRIRYASRKLLPAVRSVLPDTGNEVRTLLDEAKLLLSPWESDRSPQSRESKTRR